ncbi:putative ribonuclease H-like domain-containing protein [Tanacetum coccineum]
MLAWNYVNTASTEVNSGRFKLNTVDPSVNTTSSYELDSPKDMFKLGASHTLETTHVEFFSDEDKPEVDLGNITNSYIQIGTNSEYSSTPNTRIHKDHSLDNVIGDVQSSVQTRRMTKNTNEHGFISAVYEGKYHEDLHTCLFVCFLSQEKPKRISKALSDSAWVEAIFEAIRMFLAYASFMGFMVYQMDVKSAFLYGTIEEEVYVCQLLGFEDPNYPDKVYKVVKALHGLHQAPRTWSYMGELNFFLGLQVKQREDGIFNSQDKYVAEILRKFGFTDVRTSSTPMDTEKPFLKDSDGDDVDVHLYRSMIGSLMYLTSSRPDIMFVICACARFQVTPKVSHSHAVKRIFRYLKGQPKLGLWYPRNSPFDLVAYSDSDYAGASLDRKSTTGGCQFLGCRLISWQCKKQTVVATSSTKAEYVAATSCCGQVLWIQNQMLDYEYNFMHSMISIDNNSTICIVKNPVSHTKTKHIEIIYHFIRDCYDKKLIQVVKIHTDHNFADLLTKALDVGRISTGFAAALAVLVTGASQSRQHESHHRFFPVDTSLIHIESRKSPTKSLFDVGSRRISPSSL